MVPILMMMNRLASKRRIMKQKNVLKSSAMDYCRTCLTTEHLSDIFLNSETLLKRTQDLKLTTGLEVGFPKSSVQY